MRIPLAMILVVLAVPLLFAQAVTAAPSPRYVTLYAHGFGDAAILTALPQSNPQKAADLTNGLQFRLSPVLGRDLRISGAVTYNLYLRASGLFVGTVSAQLAELKPDGTQAVVPGATVESPLFLNTPIVPFILGVGPNVTYLFQAGSSIVLQINVTHDSGSGQPNLAWDGASVPTSVRIPTVNSATANIAFSGPRSYGRIFEAEGNGTQRVSVNATVTDAIGVYRFSGATLQLIAQNGTTITLPLNPKNSTNYSTSYFVMANFDQGQWQTMLSLRDTSGNGYSFFEPLWITTFYPVSIIVLDSDGSSLPNATLSVGAGTEAFWSAVTNASGWGALRLPSTDIVGPLSLTVGWSGTRSLFPLDVTRASTVTVQLTVFAANIRVTLFNIPVPFARVTLYQAGEAGQAFTGIDGTANLGDLPAGNYSMTVDYLLAAYQTQVRLTRTGPITVAVPFPHRTITTILAAAFVALGSVIVVRRKRGKYHPTGFDYFNELTHGGLPEACFTVIAGNSGSGKSVLLNTLALEHLETGNSVYVSNSEYPAKVREAMAGLVAAKSNLMDSQRLIFIDAYSAVGGSNSTEKFSVSSHTDLTNMGLCISKALEEAGTQADVYMDSLNPLLTTLRVDYVINFLQTVAARVKANRGRLCVTVGTAIDEHDLKKLEQFADCVIETQLQEAGNGQRRRLRIKKVRDKPYSDHWTRFRVEQGKGIIFLTRSKTLPAQKGTESIN